MQRGTLRPYDGPIQRLTETRRGTDLLAAARELVDLVEAEAEAATAQATITARTVDALHDANLFWMQVPACLGGGEVDLTTALCVIEELSRADGSVGWSVMAGATTLALAGAFFGDDAVAEIFSDPRAVTAGQVAPIGVAAAEGDGWRISGRFGFASGALHSNWIIGGFREQRDGEPVRLDNGLPNVIAAAVPKASVELLGNWDVLGLVATGSVDYEVPEQHVSGEFAFPLFTAEPKRGGSVYRLGANGLTCIAHSAFAVGVARRALDEIALVTRTKRRFGRKNLIDDPVFQHAYGKAEAELGAARAFAWTTLQDLEQAAGEDRITRELRARARLAASNACAAASNVVTMAYQFGGSHSLRNGSVIQRCFRDVAAAEQHVFTDHNTYGDAAKVLLDVAPEALFM